MELQTLAPEETRWISERAKLLGFSLCGVAPAEKFPELAQFAEWLERGYAGEMQYLHDARRLDPRSALSGVRSLVVCALNYNSALPYSTQGQPDTGDSNGPHGWISRYAWGDDYHQVLWKKLNALVAEMKTHFTEPFEARAYADTGPIHERAAAKHAGLGWLGKNTLLLNEGAGSWLFLGIILTSLPLAPTLVPGHVPPDRCGSCRACLDACPTEAIVEPYVLDASRCIAYLTIELRGPIPEGLREPMGRHVFGCDICQDVCPWNRKSPRTSVPEFQPRAIVSNDSASPDVPGGLSLYEPDLLALASLTEDQFRRHLRASPIKRTKWRGLIRNACIALGNSQVLPASDRGKAVLAALETLAGSRDSVISESALWALCRIQRTGPQDQDQHGTAVKPAPA